VRIVAEDLDSLGVRLGAMVWESVFLTFQLGATDRRDGLASPTDRFQLVSLNGPPAGALNSQSLAVVPIVERWGSRT
jgi:hypothetical protein